MARLRNGQALNDAIASKHTTVDGKLAADHKSSHSGILLSQSIRLVGLIRLVLPAIDQDQAGEAGPATADLEHGIVPTTTLAETWVQH